MKIPAQLDRDGLIRNLACFMMETLKLSRKDAIFFLATCSTEEKKAFLKLRMVKRRIKLNTERARNAEKAALLAVKQSSPGNNQAHP